MTEYDFDRMIDEYLVYCHSRQLSKKTMASYEQSLRLFPALVRRRVEDINSRTSQREQHSSLHNQHTGKRGKYSFYSGTEQKTLYKPERRRDYRKPVIPTTINNYLRNLRAFFGWLAEENYISRNPMKKVKFLKAPRKS